MNKLVGREAFVDSVRVESAGLKDKLYVHGFYGFLCLLGVGKDLP